MVEMLHPARRTAIKSLEATLEKKFEQLIAAVNKTTKGNNTGELKSPLRRTVYTNVFLCFSFDFQFIAGHFASCKDIYDNHN